MYLKFFPQTVAFVLEPLGQLTKAH